MTPYGYGAQNDAKIAASGAPAMPRTADPRTISLPYPPQSNNFKIPVRMGRGARLILSKEARQYKATVAALLADYKLPIMTGPVSVHVDLFRPRKVGDLENGIKVAIDCLSGVVFEDDKQIVVLHAYRHDDKANPRIEIMVREAPEFYGVTE